MARYQPWSIRVLAGAGDEVGLCFVLTRYCGCSLEDGSRSLHTQCHPLANAYQHDYSAAANCPGNEASRRTVCMKGS